MITIQSQSRLQDPCNRNPVTRNGFCNGGNPCAVRVVTIVTLFSNSLREKREKIQEGEKGVNNIKDECKKVVTVVTLTKNPVFTMDSEVKACYRKRYGLLQELLHPPGHSSKMSVGLTGVGANFSSPWYSNVNSTKSSFQTSSTAHERSARK